MILGGNKMFGNILNYILGLGAAIFLPIIMIIIGLIIKMKFKRALISGLTLGVAFTGMNVVLGFMFDTISPVASAFVEKTGIQLNIIDVGWSPMSAIAWAWPYALFMFPLQIGINLLMLFFKQTDILNVDLWNVWGKIFTATMVAAITGNIMLGFVAAAIQVIVELKIGEATQKRTQEITGIPGVTCTHYMTLQCVIMEPVNKLLDYIPLLKKENANADKLKDKIGIFGENSVMGFIIGGLIAILAGYSVKDTLNVAIKVGTALVLFPMVAKLFMQALAPIADAASEFMKNKFKDREIYIGLDWPFMANVVVVVPAMIVSKKNLLKMLILSILYTPIYLLVSSSFAPYATELAKTTKAIEIPAGQMITYFGVEAPFFRWAVANGLAAKIPGIIALVLFFGLFYIFVKNMKKQNQ